MTNIRSRRARGFSAWLVALFVLVAPLGALAQTRVEMPSNKYNTRDDVQVGREAAQQVYQQMPMLRDSYVNSYVQEVGRRLVAAIPPEFRHSEFSYSFDVVNARDINAFALPGGPMFVNRGMIEAARNEGEMAGVMAHEISHIALRHATAQATETQKYQIGSVLGQIAGAVIGGGVGQVIGAGSQIGFGAAALKYSRKYETQADILGAQIMARAGYDPRDLANMFRTIQQQGGGRGGPEWMSSHPDPGNRYQRINQEAALLRVNSNSATQDTRAFQQAQGRLRSMGRAPTMEEIARSGQRYPDQGGSYPDDRYPDNRYPDNRYPDDSYGRGERVAYPSSSYRTETNNLFRVSVPSNWRQIGSGDSATYAPEGAYGSQGITHGVIFGASQTRSRDLQNATREVVEGLLQGNPYLRQTGSYQRANMNGRAALATALVGRSNVTGRNEQVTIIVTQLSGGNAFYMAAVAPQDEYGSYRGTFDNILRTLQLNTRY
ncbi:MAG TPA: M48 family metallopeptidase [Pyrinomonadaceae bacterium]|nr:M48 family metallopeptidase [Pyrinomonadaceae bacterium]